MGDGIWRLLALALSLVRAQDGVYLLMSRYGTALHRDGGYVGLMNGLRCDSMSKSSRRRTAVTGWRALAAICRPDMVADSVLLSSTSEGS